MLEAQEFYPSPVISSGKRVRAKCSSNPVENTLIAKKRRHSKHHHRNRSDGLIKLGDLKSAILQSEDGGISLVYTLGTKSFRSQEISKIPKPSPPEGGRRISLGKCYSGQLFKNVKALRRNRHSKSKRRSYSKSHKSGNDHKLHKRSSLSLGEDRIHEQSSDLESFPIIDSEISCSSQGSQSIDFSCASEFSGHCDTDNDEAIPKSPLTRSIAELVDNSNQDISNEIDEVINFDHNQSDFASSENDLQVPLTIEKFEKECSINSNPNGLPIPMIVKHAQNRRKRNNSLYSKKSEDFRDIISKVQSDGEICKRPPLPPSAFQKESQRIGKDSNFVNLNKQEVELPKEILSKHSLPPSESLPYQFSPNIEVFSLNPEPISFSSVNSRSKTKLRCRNKSATAVEGMHFGNLLKYTGKNFDLSKIVRIQSKMFICINQLTQLKNASFGTFKLNDVSRIISITKPEFLQFHLRDGLFEQNLDKLHIFTWHNMSISPLTICENILQFIDMDRNSNQNLWKCIINYLCTWVIFFGTDFYSDLKLLEKIREIEFKISLNVINLNLDEKTKEKFDKYNYILMSFIDDLCKGKQKICSINDSIVIPSLPSEDFGSIKEFTVNPDVLASHYKYYDLTLYKKLTPSEFINKNWESEYKRALAPNYCQIVKHFNTITNYVYKQMTHGGMNKKAIKFWIDVYISAYKIKNILLLYEIDGAIAKDANIEKMIPIQQLKAVKAIRSEIIHPTKAGKYLYAEALSAKEKALPYLGPFLSAIVKLYENEKLTKVNDHINFDYQRQNMKYIELTLGWGLKSYFPGINHELLQQIEDIYYFS